jgi:hypothetical protein
MPDDEQKSEHCAQVEQSTKRKEYQKPTIKNDVQDDQLEISTTSRQTDLYHFLLSLSIQMPDRFVVEKKKKKK